MKGSDWTCPGCGVGHDSSDHPDHWRDGRGFEFECDCGATFMVDVDFSPQFYVLRSTLKVKTP